MDTAAIHIVDKLYHAAFDQPGEPHSPEYMAGARAALWDRVNGVSRSPIRQDPPYPMGTTQADAWLSGYHQGLLIWASH